MAEKMKPVLGLRLKSTLLLALFSAVLMAGTMLLMEHDLRHSLINENIEKGLGIARGVAFNAEDPLLTGDDLYLFSAVRNARKSPGVLYALIEDEKGVVRAADNVELVGKPLTLNPDGARDLLRRGEGYEVCSYLWNGEATFDLRVPIVTVADPNLHLGAIHLGLSESVVNEAVERMQRHLLAMAVAALLVGGVAASVVATFLVRPVNSLVEGVRAIGQGDLQQRIESRRKDELGVLTRAFNDMAASLREKEFIKNTFERYVSKPLAEQILRHKDELQLGGEEKEVTILFCDIRGFTTLTENLPPNEVVEMLNTYFTRMVQIITEHNGMVDKFMGDSVMALFGAPLQMGDDPLMSVKAALKMHLAVEEINAIRQSEGFSPLHVGIGINTGAVVAGNVGSQNRMEYTVIGDNVNIASRLQAMAAPGEVLITESTYRHLRNQVRATPLEPVVFKGKAKPVDIYRLGGLV